MRNLLKASCDRADGRKDNVAFSAKSRILYEEAKEEMGLGRQINRALKMVKRAHACDIGTPKYLETE